MKLSFKIFILLSFLFLNSCSISLQSIIDSLNYSKNSADFLSYVTTDKTTTDHALSYMFKKDCSLARTLKLKQICQEVFKEKLIINNKEKLDTKKTKKVYKKRIVKIKKIKVPSMAY
ncbi:MAG: hypothetical protein MK002_00370 [Alphaproteobacteria bacterium]|jgi:hypothetical protein|nr:hypothetical protein [Alphaproteobacteria bacterium]|tara:strand:+ start:1267 stop:1617 length:351 start_codon:yes stop_codon:yes gene_type:complete